MPANSDMSPLDRISGAFHAERFGAKVDFSIEVLEAVFPEDDHYFPHDLVDWQLEHTEDGFGLRVLVGWLKRKMKIHPREDWKRQRIVSPLQTLARNKNLPSDLVDMLVDAGIQEVAGHRKISELGWAKLIRHTSPETDVMIHQATQVVHLGGRENWHYWMPDRIFPIYFRKLWRSVRARKVKEAIEGADLTKIMARDFDQGDLRKVLVTVTQNGRRVGAKMAVELLDAFWTNSIAQRLLGHPDLPLWKLEWAIKECWGNSDQASVSRLQTIMALPRTPERYLRIWYAHAENWPHLALNPALPADLATTIWEVSSYDVRGRLLRHPAIPADVWREHILGCMCNTGGWGSFLGSPEDLRRTLDDPRMDADTWVEMFTALRRLSLSNGDVEDLVAEFFLGTVSKDGVMRTSYRSRQPAPLPAPCFTRMVGDLCESRADGGDRLRFYQTLRRVLTAADGFPSKMLLEIYDAVSFDEGNDVRTQMNIVTMLGQQENRHEVAAIIDLHAEQLVKDAFATGVEQADPLDVLRKRNNVLVPATAQLVDRAS